MSFFLQLSDPNFLSQLFFCCTLWEETLQTKNNQKKQKHEQKKKRQDKTGEVKTKKKQNKQHRDYNYYNKTLDVYMEQFVFITCTSSNACLHFSTITKKLTKTKL